MTRNFRIEQTSSVGSSGSLMPITRDSNVFMQSDTGSMGTSRKDLLMTNQELAQANQRLQGKVQKLTSAYQAVEQQNVSLRDRCLKLQNRVDELKSFLASIKVETFSRDGVREYFFHVDGRGTASASNAADRGTPVRGGLLP